MLTRLSYFRYFKALSLFITILVTLHFENIVHWENDTLVWVSHTLSYQLKIGSCSVYRKKHPFFKWEWILLDVIRMFFLHDRVIGNKFGLKRTDLWSFILDSCIGLKKSSCFSLLHYACYCIIQDTTQVMNRCGVNDRITLQRLEVTTDTHRTHKRNWLFLCLLPVFFYKIEKSIDNDDWSYNNIYVISSKIFAYEWVCECGL